MKKDEGNSLGALAHRWVKHEESMPLRKNQHDDKFLQWLEDPTMPRFITSWWRGMTGLFRGGKK